MKVNFQDTPEMDDFTPVPEGTYLCRVGTVKTANDKGPLVTKSGEPMWELKMVILQPAEYEGKSIRDIIIFAFDPKSASAKRLKFVTHRFGINLNNVPDFDLQPQHFEGKVARVKVKIEERTYEDKEGNQKKAKDNKVEFNGYESVTADEEKKESLPF